MVCSSCGFENQSAMRYCVMCGMPLPHRPLSTPGAQSTLNFTRVPVESGSTSTDYGTSTTGSSVLGVLEPSGNGSTGRTDAVTVPAPTSAQDSASVTEAPPRELVPDVSLDEYIQKFRYQPPTDPDEVTMRGDAPPIVESEAPSAPHEANPATADSPSIEAASGQTYPPPGPVLVTSHPHDSEVIVTAELPPDSVASRLGLEPETPAEERIQRPRFLDVNEPAKENKQAASSGTSTIVGPSFLGLSDPPEIDVELSSAQDEESPRPSHWRGWLAAAVLVLFAVLGVMEWRSQANLANQGIVQVISAKLRNWRHAANPAPSGDATSNPPAASDANSRPDMQVQPQSELAKPGSPETASTPPPSPAASTTSTPSPAAGPPNTSSPPARSAVSNSTPPQTTDSLVKATTPSESTTKNPGASTSQPAKASAAPAKSDIIAASKPAGDQTAAAKPAALGADEMAKAKNASDAAAAAAWLWKATAKGNPDAPVQLADMYIKGNGVPRSCEQAMVLLKTAAAKENATARNRLGSMYATGNCVQRNRVEAYRWMSAALTVNPYSQWAQQNREQLWQQMTPEEQAAAQKYR